MSKNETLRRYFTWVLTYNKDFVGHHSKLFHQVSETAAVLFRVVPVANHVDEFEEYFSQLTINSNPCNTWFPEFFAAYTNCTPGECGNDTSVISLSRYKQDYFVPLVVDAVYAFAHALHDFLAENCNATSFAPFLWVEENTTCLGQSHELNGSSLLEYLGRVNFTSITGRTISFNNRGSVDGHYEVVNYQASISEDGVVGYSFETVGTWDGSKQEDRLILTDDTRLQFGVAVNGALRAKPVESECGGCGPGVYLCQVHPREMLQPM